MRIIRYSDENSASFSCYNKRWAHLAASAKRLLGVSSASSRSK